MSFTSLPVGATGLLVALAGSYADNLLGDGVLVTVLQVVLWLLGGLLMLAGAASTAMLRAKGHEHVLARRRGRRDPALGTPVR